MRTDLDRLRDIREALEHIARKLPFCKEGIPCIGHAPGLGSVLYPADRGGSERDLCRVPAGSPGNSLEEDRGHAPPARSPLLWYRSGRGLEYRTKGSS